jgi:hypothetical protein
MNWSRMPRRLLGVLLAVICMVAAGVGVALARGVVTRSDTVKVPPKAKRAATATCPKGKSVAMGGFRNEIATDDSPEVQPIGLTRPSKRTWKDSATNVFAPAGDATSIAYCGRSRKLTERTRTTVVPAAKPSTQPKSVTAKCPRGTRVAFGGFKADFDPNFGPNTGAIWISALRRGSNRTWRASGLNLGNDAGKLTAVAYCGHVAKTTKHSASALVPARKRRSATATCPRGQKLAFGGFVAPLTYSAEFVQIDSAVRASGRTWTAQAVNTSNSLTAGTLRSLAYCRSRR